MLLTKIKNVLLDSSCILCGSKNLSENINFICKKCHIIFSVDKSNTCRICGHNLTESKTCPSCIKFDKIYYDSYDFVQHYTGFFKDIIYMWKMDDNFMINKLFFKLIEEKNILNKNIPVTVVPEYGYVSFKKGRASLVYFLKMLERKGFKTEKNIYKRKYIFTKSQKEKSWEKRINEIKDNYYLPEKNIDKYHGEIYLIDDIYTTGATVNYGAKLLKDAGFEKVHVVSFFRSSLFDKE
jgi:competence protein ComFC